MAGSEWPQGQAGPGESSCGVCETDDVPLPHGEAPRVSNGGRLAGRWRYDRTAGRGIALSYDRNVNGPLVARRPQFRGGGRWRYDRVAGRGIRLCYDRTESRSAPVRAEPEPPPPTSASTVRVLCTCGTDFTFDGGAAACPSCGRLAEWPTIGPVEREMRADLEELLRTHEQ